MQGSRLVAVSTAISAKNGLLIRNRGAFERARNLQAIVFDKTGTLTEGRFGVSDVLVFDPERSEDEILTLAASVEADSEHPIARGILASATKTLPVTDFSSITGKGARGTVEGKQVHVVSPGFLREKGIRMEDPRIEELSGQGKTVVHVLVAGRPAPWPWRTSSARSPGRRWPGSSKWVSSA